MVLPYCQLLLDPKFKQTAETQKFVGQVSRFTDIVVHKGKIEVERNNCRVYEEYGNKAFSKPIFVKIEFLEQIVYYRHTAEYHLPVEVCGISYSVAAFPNREYYHKRADNAYGR